MKTQRNRRTKTSITRAESREDIARLINECDRVFIRFQYGIEDLEIRVSKAAALSIANDFNVSFPRQRVPAMFDNGVIKTLYMN